MTLPEKQAIYQAIRALNAGLYEMVGIHADRELRALNLALFPPPRPPAQPEKQKFPKGRPSKVKK